MFDELTAELRAEAWYNSLSLAERIAYDRRMQKAAEEANTERTICQLVPGHGFTVKRIPQSPFPASQRFRFWLHIVRYIIDTACIKVTVVWVLSVVSGSIWPTFWSVSIPLCIYLLFSYIRHRGEEEPPPKYINIL